MNTRFLPLTVTAVEKTIRDAVVLTLQPEDAEAFAFTQGQYLTFSKDFAGTELRRNYSICTAPGGPIQVGIKRVDGGAFSTWANTDLAPGEVLHAMPPAGRFHAPIEPEASKHYLGFAGGSGITPILSILRTVLAREPLSRFTLIYANRAVSTIMFREELEDLKNLHLGRLNVIHVLESDSQDIDLFTGQLTPEKCSALFHHWVDVASADHAFICGPEPMMITVRDALQDAGMGKDRIKIELFKSAQTGRLAKPVATAASSQAKGTAATVTLDGRTRTLEIPRDGTPLLDAVNAHSMDAPFACKAGVCSTCRAKLIEGEVEMIANHALEDYEVRAGYILTCQSVPLTDTVVLDYDQ
ncbi:Phenylacetate-CoA oxygenase/reductase, PaaK subunit [Candidatus Rhodobacter oscarellae]|uniref:Phenylacetate-CoA oxygenase/reductase, PaaK subunit n=1 Tax=Candidatus Rhodobacter oscarellae TaxID=1675527 RepID=A0A0J9EBW2_9RHOB|nr:2Fe-2S iron-sulfur cluster-binding protein [Candidatus Rhodobacter lobularis]KMW60270.1 Phenylacetate-CoA oxygenase/reductase, PaaK subunit [Candidatus Rhodobacter lobularis]